MLPVWHVVLAKKRTLFVRHFALVDGLFEQVKCRGRCVRITRYSTAARQKGYSRVRKGGVGNPFLGAWQQG